jgi:acetyl esterase/lipase
LAHSEIDAIRTLLGSKPRPVGWPERRQRLDEVGSTSPAASDVTCEAVDGGRVAGEWSIVPGGEPSRALLYFHGGGYCSGSIVTTAAWSRRPGARRESRCPPAPG